MATVWACSTETVWVTESVTGCWRVMAWVSWTATARATE
jgi:hypothetical protein